MSAVLETSANEIINAALLDSGIIRPDQIVADDKLRVALQRLNTLTKRWQAQGHHLWSQTEGCVFMNVDQQSYQLGPDGDEATRSDDFIETTTTAALVATDTTISVADTTGMLGAAEIITIDPISTQFWTVTDGTIAVVSEQLELTNGTDVAAFADFDLTCTVGETYRTRNGFVLGTAIGATFSVIDPVTSDVLVSSSVTANATVDLEFTATQETMTFRFANDSTTTGETSLLSSLSQIDKASGDRVGIRQDDNTRHWTDIVEVVDSTTLTINEGMISASASGRSVFTYTNIMERPLDVYNPRRRTSADFNTEIPILIWSREEYMSQPLKSSQGTVVQLYYSRQLGEGILFVWQTAADVDQVVKFTFDRPLQVSVDQLDEPDFPSEWFDALKWNLAKELLSAYSVPADVAQMVTANAQSSLIEALDFDTEPGSLYIMPSDRAYPWRR